MSRGLVATSLVRLGLVAALSLTLSGAPQAAAEVAGTMGPCAEECGGSAGHAGCPPTCPHGVCARIAPAAIGAAAECGTVAPEPPRCPFHAAEPVAPPPGDGVFHPPTP